MHPDTRSGGGRRTPPRRAWLHGARAAALIGLPTILVGIGSLAMAATPHPSASGTSPQCATLIIPGSVQECQSVGSYLSQNGAGTQAANISNPLNPLDDVGSACADAAQWLIEHLSGAVSGSTSVDFTNKGFLQQYAVVFAAATILTLVLWLLAVVKRTVRGDGIGTAVGEATGLLWIAVIASAFTPVVLAGMVKITDAVTDAISAGTTKGTNNFLDNYAHSLNSSLGGGSIMLIFLSLLSMIAAAVLWIELIVRAAMLYVGAALAAAVYAGLVDRALWVHVRRWAGMMVAIDFAKPIIVVVLSLATAVAAGEGKNPDAMSSVLAGLAILFLSIFASTVLYRFVPHFGDDMMALRQGRAAAQLGKGTSAMVDGPAARMQQGIAAHAARSGGQVAAPEAPKAIGGPSAGVAMSAGVVAHGARGAASRLSQARHTAPPPPQPPAAPPPSRPTPPPPRRQIGPGD
jgi:hypothetical protein